jgi:ABC-type antimicrobial peptide transport system permease subunit
VVTAGPKPIVVSRQLARRLFGDESALGRTIEADPRMGTDLVPMAIVGVVEDRLTGWAMTSSALTDGSMIYQPMPATATTGYLLVRARANAGNLADRIRATLRAEIGTAVAVTSLDARLRESVSFVRSLEALLVALGVMSLGLALVGVIGSVSFDAHQRRKEFAIRLALGAGPSRVRQHVLQSGLRAVYIGLALGILASWGTLTATETMRLLPLRSVAADPIPYALVGALLLTAALLTLGAVAVPAGRRDPLESLREE